MLTSHNHIKDTKATTIHKKNNATIQKKKKNNEVMMSGFFVGTH